MAVVVQKRQLENPDSRILFEERGDSPLLSQHAQSLQGIKTGDDGYSKRCFWELPKKLENWKWFQSTVDETLEYGGCEYILRWENDGSEIARLQGQQAWGKCGVSVSLMRELRSCIYFGEVFDSNVAAVVVENRSIVLPLWAYCSSGQFDKDVRVIDPRVNAMTGSLTKVPFDLAHWQKVAAEKYPHGLPKPFSSDPTQWLFNGHPKGADQPMHVAVARLLGYQWPRQTGSSFPDCPALGQDGLEKHADVDGIVCLNPLRGDPPATDRLIALLGDAFGSDWSSARLASLLAEVDFAGETLEDWLRDGFFAQHCQLFHQRPFIWHVWDGRADGFHAFVNYHTLAGKKGKRTLETLIYTYLGDWIDHQREDQKTGVEGADGRLAAAEHLKGELEKILAGEPPYDLFVRWKPLTEQPIGWEPDINDGVRINIRPFMTAKPLATRGKGACIMRTTPKIKWEKDRGKEPQRAKEDFPWFWTWDEAAEDFSGTKIFDGNRWNDLHYTRAFKEAARERGKK